MRKRVLISVDIGTQGTKAAAVDLEGNIVAEALSFQLDHTPAWCCGGRSAEMLSSVINTIKAVELGSAEVLAVGVDGQMPVSWVSELMEKRSRTTIPGSIPGASPTSL